jgi:hypothetical protein
MRRPLPVRPGGAGAGLGLYIAIPVKDAAVFTVGRARAAVTGAGALDLPAAQIPFPTPRVKRASRVGDVQRVDGSGFVRWRRDGAGCVSA